MIKRGTFIEVKVIHRHENKNITDVFLRGVCLKDCKVGEYAEIVTVMGNVVSGIVSENSFFYGCLGANSKNIQRILFIREKK